MKKLSLLSILMYCIAASNAFGMSSVNYRQDVDVFSGGGGVASSAGYVNVSTIGQPSAIGQSASAGYANAAGYLAEVILSEQNEHLVSTLAGPGGTIDPASRLVTHGSTTTFTVTPSTGYSIGIVTGCGGSLSSNTYTTGPITADCTVIATFAQNQYTISASAGPGGTISPASRLVTYGTTTTFTVTPNAGYTAVMGGTCGGSPPSGTVQFTYTTSQIFGDCTVSVVFTPPAQYSLIVTKHGNGTVTSTPGGITCGTTCGATFTQNTQVLLTATPDPGWNFIGWTGGGCTGTGICQVTMDSAKTVMARFAAPSKIGVFQNGYWYLDKNQTWDWNGAPPDVLGVFGIGLTGAVPVTGDWTGDGTTKIGVYIDGIWYLDMNNNWQWDGDGIDLRGVFGVGLPNAVPVTGDWNGDGITEIGIYSNGYWYLDINRSWDWNGTPTDTFGIFGVGLPNAVPVTGDWNGDGITEIGIYSNGYWYLDKNRSWDWNGTPTDTLGIFGVGLLNVIPVTGDWNGDGITKIGVYSDGYWYLDTNASWQWDGTPTDTFGIFGVGLGPVTPVTGSW